jgi:hypothetical protein
MCQQRPGAVHLAGWHAIIPVVALQYTAASAFDVLPSVEVIIPVLPAHPPSRSRKKYLPSAISSHVVGGAHYLPPEEGPEAAARRVASSVHLQRKSYLLRSTAEIAEAAAEGLPVAPACRQNRRWLLRFTHVWQDSVLSV